MGSSESSSPFSLSSQSSLTTDGFEGLEVMEFDPSTLQEVLYGLGEGGETTNEEAMEEDGRENEDEPLGVENWWCFDQNKDVIGNLEWVDTVMEETCNEMAVWCEEVVNEGYELLAIPPSGIVCDDIGYIGLWQDS